MPAPIDSVTALLMHDGELFLAHRHPALQTFAGHQAFPGGKVDPEDAIGDAFEHPVFADIDARLARALCRELQEELDFDLVRFADEGGVRSISECGHALTPMHIPRRFNTHFFAVHLERRPNFVLHQPEAISCKWASAQEWLAEFERGQFIIAPPTIACIRALARDPQCGHMGNLVAVAPPGQLLAIESVAGLIQIPVRSHTLPPAEHTNCYVAGELPGQRLAIDPSPCDDAELDRLSDTLVAQGVNTLLITHHHPDHHERADALARRHGWPVLMSARTAERIRERKGAAFFEGIELRLVAEGDAVASWCNEPIHVLEVPGHDDGQIALMTNQRTWCIVGDLIQGVGTVVIAKPEGNMRQYFESMQRIIDLAPLSIFPSHGQGLGSTFRLEETLRHRKLREEHVLQLHREGRSIEQMLDAIYVGVDPRLLPLARKNIESHLEKLEAEGLLSA